MGRKRNQLLAVAASAVLAIGLAGCGGGSDSTGAGKQQERSDAVKGGDITYLQVAVTEHLDPQRTYVGRDISNLGRLVYRSWVQFPQGETDPAKGTTPEPDLATDTGTANEDATQWKFTLKDGPIWQDGKPITCEDFKYGVSRTFATDVITGGPNYIIGYLDVPSDADGSPAYKGPYSRVGQDLFDKAVTCDGNTITYNFKKPWPDFPLAIAALRSFDPYREDVDKGDKNDLFVLSDGPYMLDGEWDEDSGGTFVRNPKWDSSEDTGREANFDSINIQVGLDPEVIIDRLIANEGDDQNAIAAVNITSAQYPEITGDVADRAVNIESPFTNYLLPNFNRVTNVKVRQALALATNRAAYVGALGGDKASTPAQSIVSPVVPGLPGQRPLRQCRGWRHRRCQEAARGVRRGPSVPDQVHLPDRLGGLQQGVRCPQGHLRPGRLRRHARRSGPPARTTRPCRSRTPTATSSGVAGVLTGRRSPR